jgi:uncharacterized protein DUF5710
MPRVELRVPFHEKDDAKRLGARWDADRKTWFVPAGADLHAFERWLPEAPHINVRSSMYWIVTSTRKCWKCDRGTEVFAFALPEGHFCLEIDDSAPPESCEIWERGELNVVPHYIDYLTETVQGRMREVTPHYRIDFSQTTCSSYWMNHCEYCGSKQGDYELFCEPGVAFMPITPQQVSRIRTVQVFESFAAGAGGLSYDPEFLSAST